MWLDRGGAYLAACTIYRDDAAYLAEWTEAPLAVWSEALILAMANAVPRRMRRSASVCAPEASITALYLWGRLS